MISDFIIVCNVRTVYRLTTATVSVVTDCLGNLNKDEIGLSLSKVFVLIIKLV